ncbi:trehalose-6-phosphate synthase [Halobiforma lacisalsi AJ5]|uniref:Trehalose-6-phosphate synthase n=1 Tax=Natronobacterium lacisalsi AJ5 TaxID=358396 RepID=M0L1H6_NATLA|nr:trehalose-6-phosphate synthase [Halobiforma lacisalsi]APW96318.1 trehalose-6-phosphate synthase [Halobiforma lacisalsi AJ5]EMA27412.1 trehalose-6-phosphate synthase [Halobiforma lacisalsi AJ5]
MPESPSSRPAWTLSASSPLRKRDLVVVSNREPYVHSRTDDGIAVERSAGGLTTALDPVLRRLGGTWVAWGSGDADAAVADDGTVRVPPEEPAYDLERVFLAESTVEDYYYGYSNSTLWPLCHGDLGRIRSEPSHWPAYERANERFADAVVEGVEGGDPDPIVWIQDYHFALLSDRLRSRSGLPDAATIAQFWHVPWPSPDAVRVSPHARELLEGLLGNDLLGFHLPAYRRNFLETVDRLLPGASVDREAGIVRSEGTGSSEPERTRVYARPIGIDVSSARRAESTEEPSSVFEDYELDPGRSLLLGVERLDYAKGIRERLRAFEHLLETEPRWRESVTHLMVAGPTREQVPEYRRYQRRVREQVAAINARFGTDDWTPVRHVEAAVDWERLLALYRAADALVVSSRRDGLNLVAMEYVAANAGGTGTLVLSELAGASEILEGAIEINPYDVAGTAAAIDRALSLEIDEADEAQERLESLSESVRRHDVGEWVRSFDREVRALATDAAARGDAGAGCDSG